MGREVTVEVEWLSPHSCPEWTGDSGTWVLGEWATRCPGNKKGVPHQVLQNSETWTLREKQAGGRGGVGAWGEGAATPGFCTQSPCASHSCSAHSGRSHPRPSARSTLSGEAAGGPTRHRASPPAQLASPRAGPILSRRNSPTGSWDAVTPGFRKRAGSQEAHRAPHAHLGTHIRGRGGTWSRHRPRGHTPLGRTLRAGPEARRSATCHRGLDSSAHPTASSASSSPGVTFGFCWPCTLPGGPTLSLPPAAPPLPAPSPGRRPRELPTPELGAGGHQFADVPRCQLLQGRAACLRPFLFPDPDTAWRLSERTPCRGLTASEGPGQVWARAEARRPSMMNFASVRST